MSKITQVLIDQSKPVGTRTGQIPPVAIVFQAQSIRIVGVHGRQFYPRSTDTRTPESPKAPEPPLDQEDQWTSAG